MPSLVVASSAPKGLSIPLGSALQPADSGPRGETCADLGGLTTAGLENRFQISAREVRTVEGCRPQPSVLGARKSNQVASEHSVPASQAGAGGGGKGEG